jgi:hypothetical protein
MMTKLAQELERRAGLAGCRRARLRTAEYYRLCRKLGAPPDDGERYYLEALLEEITGRGEMRLASVSYDGRDYRANYSSVDD